ncbi:MAG: metalloregulator ArsR/SmtB family transcription factor [Vicinamibacteria bacterium]
MDEARATPEGLLGFMDSLGDPARLRLLRLLERNELGVADLVELMRLPQSTVSRHLKILVDHGWLKGRAEGANRLYRMPPPADGAARRLWSLAKEQTEGWLTAREDRLRLERLRAERPAGALAFFAGAAARWDKLRGELYGAAFTDEALLSLLPAEWVVADLACGSGHAAARLSPCVRRVIGVDQSAAMLTAARKRTAGLPNVELRRGELEALPLDDASVDAALLLLALTYVPEPRGVLEELARVLKPGGRAVVVDLLRHDREDFREQMGQLHPGFEPEQLGELLEEAGLGAVSARALAPAPQAKGPALLLAAGARGERAKQTTVTGAARRRRQEEVER